MKRLRLNYTQNGKTWWWWVLVFPSKQGMWDWYSDWCRKTGKVDRLGPGGFGAQHVPYTRHRIRPGGTEEMSGNIGMLMFYRGNMGASIVTHEIVHAALQYLRVASTLPKLDDENCDDEEERLAYTISDLTKLLVRKFYAHKIY